MNCLIAQLPQPATSGDWHFALQHADGRLHSEGVVPMAELPRASSCVLLLPWQALSWHAVQLPAIARARGAKLRQMLVGALEEEVLQDPEALHFAVAPKHANALKSIQVSTWVGVCDKAWLKQGLQALQASGQRIVAVVPEFWPQHLPGAEPMDAAAPHDVAQLKHHLLGHADQAWLLQTGGGAPAVLAQIRAAGAKALAVPPPPADAVRADFGARGLVGLTAHAQQALSQALMLHTEPACAALAERLLPARVAVQHRSSAWLGKQAEHWGGWNWAQFDLQVFCARHWGDRVQALVRNMVFAPQWRWFRAGAVALVAVHLLGWGAWVWGQARERQALRQQINQTVIQAFPHISLVVDAPLQMQRELARLRQRAGVLAADDFEALLQALSRAVAVKPGAEPQPLGLTQLDYTDRRLRFSSLVAPKLDSNDSYAVRALGDQWGLQLKVVTSTAASIATGQGGDATADARAQWETLQSLAQEAQRLQAQLGQGGGQAAGGTGRNAAELEQALLALWQQAAAGTGGSGGLGGAGKVVLKTVGESEGGAWKLSIQAMPASAWLQALQSSRNLGVTPKALSLKLDISVSASNALLWTGTLELVAAVAAP
jgi:general secretion pathway protein L